MHEHGTASLDANTVTTSQNVAQEQLYKPALQLSDSDVHKRPSFWYVFPLRLREKNKRLRPFYTVIMHSFFHHKSKTSVRKRFCDSTNMSCQLANYKLQFITRVNPSASFLSECLIYRQRNGQIK